ncbi:MAG: hypothetical protein AAF682_31125 [Planctomycetota bacterium]
MAKKKTKKAAASKRRKRRSPEQIISDLQEEIRRVRDRAKQKELKNSPAMKAASMAVKALDKALDAAAEEGHTTLRHVLAEARKPLGIHLEKQGLRLPKANLPKGRKPRELSEG